MQFEILLILACLASTLFMTGVIWVVQIVHYPLFANVGETGFLGYHAIHSSQITSVVLPPMLIEAASAFMLVLVRPASMPLWAAIAGLALVGVIWASTFFLQVPLHNQLGTLATDQRPAAITGLVATNWIRTIAWTARSMLMLWIVARMLL